MARERGLVGNDHSVAAGSKRRGDGLWFCDPKKIKSCVITEIDDSSLFDPTAEVVEVQPSYPNELSILELLGAWEPPKSSCFKKGDCLQRSHFCVFM